MVAAHSQVGASAYGTSEKVSGRDGNIARANGLLGMVRGGGSEMVRRRVVAVDERVQMLKRGERAKE